MQLTRFKLGKICEFNNLTNFFLRRKVDNHRDPVESVRNWSSLVISRFHHSSLEKFVNSTCRGHYITRFDKFFRGLTSITLIIIDPVESVQNWSSCFKFRKVRENKVFELLHETIWRVFRGINQRNVDNHRSSWVCPKLEFVVGPCSWVMSAIILFCLWCGQWAAVVNCCQTKLSANSAADWLRPLLILSYSALTQTTHTEKKRGETKQVSSRTPRIIQSAGVMSNPSEFFILNYFDCFVSYFDAYIVFISSQRW